MNGNPILFYIDDDQDDLLLFEFAASKLNVALQLFDSAEELFTTLKNSDIKPSVLFVDLNMPVKSGFEIMQEIKAEDDLKQIPVVVLSTAGDNYTAEKSRKAGADYYIPKPTSHEKLAKAISYTLGIDWNDFNPDMPGFVHRH
jgi:CheY-like chemotaxis protein